MRSAEIIKVDGIYIIKVLEDDRLVEAIEVDWIGLSPELFETVNRS